jgi:hypothetical protein
MKKCRIFSSFFHPFFQRNRIDLLNKIKPLTESPFDLSFQRKNVSENKSKLELEKLLETNSFDQSETSFTTPVRSVIIRKIEFYDSDSCSSIRLSSIDDDDDDDDNNNGYDDEDDEEDDEDNDENKNSIEESDASFDESVDEIINFDAENNTEKDDENIKVLSTKTIYPKFQNYINQNSNGLVILDCNLSVKAIINSSSVPALDFSKRSLSRSSSSTEVSNVQPTHNKKRKTIYSSPISYLNDLLQDDSINNTDHHENEDEETNDIIPASLHPAEQNNVVQMRG